ncbi:signal peptide peptidase SppA [Facklamia languida]
MNKKKWIVVAFALILVVAASFSTALKPQNQPTMEEKLASESFNQLFNKEAGFQEEVREPGNSQSRILVIPIKGAIAANSTSYQQELILDTIEQIRQDETIKAVLLEIDTPGGAVYETREAYDLFKEVMAERDIPVYASMGAVAASAGYYFATLADKIYATPETITGSIGVITSGMNMQELFEKIGIDQYVFKSGDLKDMGSNHREMTEEEKMVMQNYINESFDRFVHVVMEGRGMSEEQVRELADGRIYTASQAVKNGLIDDLKYYRQVIDLIREENNLEGAEVFEKISSKDKFASLFSPFMKSEPNYAEQFDQVINRIEEAQKVKVEYRWEGGFDHASK